MAIVGLIFFGILGLTLGYAAPGWKSWVALVVPVIFALLTAYSDGFEARLIPLVVVSLAVTAAGVLAGKALDAAFSNRPERG